ncbi:MAG: rhodanese-like domain-containing protein [Alphaproteobacteria bacterium]|nr:rhodanese-like domain-containing protein [Alphaproteobacteria bacterium]
MSVKTIDAHSLHAALRSGREIALIDLREQGSFGARHILRAVNMPRSRFELLYRRMIPRKTVQIVLCDAGEGLVASVADILAFAGWKDVAILDGGVDAWEAAGFPLFSGVNVPSKAFGEYVEAKFGTPHISAQRLHQMQQSGEDIVILDSRPFTEFNALSIPGGIDVPGAELVHRVKTIAPNPQTTIVVNCAGRTRSIIGAQSLINAGVPNPVVALENGTMGWMLAGLECAKGNTELAPPPDKVANDWAMSAAQQVGTRFGVQRMDWDAVSQWRGQEDRTTYLLDVRTAEEFQAGHIPCSHHAPGGQLVQATDEFVGILNSRLVLIDDTETRAMMTAAWLRQLGWQDVSVLKGGIGTHGVQTGPAPEAVFELDLMPVSHISAQDALALDDALMIDFSSSLSHRKGHPKGARFAIRARALEDLKSVLCSRLLVFTARDPRIATLAAQDMMRAGVHRIRVLIGGTIAWEQAGGPMESGIDAAFSAEDDVFHKPYDITIDKTAMQRYIDWELALVPQVKREGTLTFPDFPASVHTNNAGQHAD